MINESKQPGPLSFRRIIKTWWPLAFSWLLMSIELTGVTAIIARFADPKINLAAYGSIAYPISLVIEGPILMILVASTALSKDMASFLKVRRYMIIMGMTLTAIHILLAFTPLYYSVVIRLIRPPVEIIEPARIGLMIMTPFSFSVAYRRFNQGVLIRFGESNAVALGTLIRLIADWTVLGAGYLIGTIPAVVVATTSVITGTCTEALYTALRVKPLVRDKIIRAPAVEHAITLESFVAFYVPLALTSMASFILEPVISASLSRMPLPLESMAVWPVVSGFLFMMQTPGIAFTEVAVTLLDEPNSSTPLSRFDNYLIAILAVCLVLFIVTPAAPLWFQAVSGLVPPLNQMAAAGLVYSFLSPGLVAAQSWFQAVLVHSRRTRSITEAVVIRVAAMSSVLIVGVLLNRFIGVYVVAISTIVGQVLQIGWLWHRSIQPRRALQARDESFAQNLGDELPVFKTAG